MDAEPSIVVRGVGRTYGREQVLKGVDLEVRPGELLGLIGPNGGGKSTLLMLLAGLVTPSEGEVAVLQTPADELARAETGAIGLVTAEPGLYPLLTGTENLHFFGRLYGLSNSEIDAASKPLTDELGLGASSLAKRVGTWSSGMRQKLSLARALLLRPKVLLLDEPTANLDPLSSHTLFAAVRGRADLGMTVVLATHDLYAAERLCDRVAVINGGIEQIVVQAGDRTPPVPGRLHAVFPEES